MNALPKRAVLWRMAAAGLLAAIVVAAWIWTPLGDYATIDGLVSVGAYLRSSPWSTVIVIAAFVLGGLAFVPLTAPVAATALIFGPVQAFCLATSGTLLSALMGFTVGYFLGNAPLRYLGGNMVNRISEGAGRHGIMLVTTLRLVPIAHFSLINLASGASHVRLRDFILGTILGCIPGIAAIAVIGNETRDFARDPDPWSFLWLVAVAALGIAMMHLLRRRMRHYSRDHGKDV